MRERLAKMRIEAATLAGGEVNQDYYAYGETYALVLDGASSFLSEQTAIDAITYVSALGKALAAKLTVCPVNEIADVVAKSIDEVASEYNLEEERSPSSTVAIAKWDDEVISIYVLGDSSCLIVDINGKKTELTDNKILQFGENIRYCYRKRLSDGYGFDEEHRNLLKNLQLVQKEYRNVENGYWIASTSGFAAHYGIKVSYPKNTIDKIFLYSDGVGTVNLNELNNLDNYLMEKHEREMMDVDGIAFPRSKVHDDKTIIEISNNSRK